MGRMLPVGVHHQGMGESFRNGPLHSLQHRRAFVNKPGPLPVEGEEQIILERDSAGLHVLQRLRDEAHRFAVGYHRTKRSEELTKSILDDLDGVGPARKRALLNFFGSPDRVKRATADELEAVPGLPAKVARSIYEQLHRLEGNMGRTRAMPHKPLKRSGL